MEGSRVISNNVDGSRENCSSADGRPPIPNSIGGRGAYRHSFNSNGTTPLCTKSLVRHPSLVKIRSPNISIEPRLGGDDGDAEYTPLLRSGAWADIGSRSNMEDVYVFDGHGGKHAADFACYHLPRFIVEDEDFPQEIERVMSSAFLQTDTAFAEACSSDTDLASGTTALAAVVIGSSLVVANAGDCRAVLCRRGCDGIWDVFMSQNAVDFARRRLQEHNDPVMCSRDLVDEALKRKSGDNLSVVVVCFQAQPPPNLIVPRGRVQRSISAEGLKELQSFLDNLDN
ncbi:UNVERIFIED_CONTAM: putative protein phosphatase 2C 22 [Sesamum calycinum]|uniref:PPM-type phosphatase domain-containing protein n=1 Tax=Sesamum calycinum TaxID=2727403 RepID=A0AAW2LXM0_9LAMI